jgi:PPK2 family polyphosphate:nucleotide phosphotransferase
MEEGELLRPFGSSFFFSEWLVRASVVLMKLKPYRVAEGQKVKLKDFKTSDTGSYQSKDEAEEVLGSNIERMRELQSKFYASNSYSLLLIFQAMDAAGKDGAIKHVMSGLNPQGCRVASFKAPSAIEMNHDYLWRCHRELPERGQIGIFNRSYYEEVLIVRVHPEFLEAQKIPDELKGDGIWKRRYREINQWERYLHDNGTRVVKFFLHLSKDEQRERFLDRINRPEKNWKFSASDVKERGFWDEYQRAYEEALQETSTDHAPWYIIPADKKWFSRALISDVVVQTLENLDLAYPEVGDDQLKRLAEAKELLEAEDK